MPFSEDNEKIILNNFFEVVELYNANNINTEQTTIIESRIKLLKTIIDLDQTNLNEINKKEKLLWQKETEKEQEKEMQKEKEENMQKLHYILEHNKFKDGEVIWQKWFEGHRTTDYNVNIVFTKQNLVYHTTNMFLSQSLDGKIITQDNTLKFPEYKMFIGEIYNNVNIDNNTQDGGKKTTYKITDTKVQVLHNKKMLTRNVYMKKNTKYCKINNKFILLSKLKKYI
jgi:hypothetical protein